MKGANLVSLKGSVMSSSVFWGVYGLQVHLSANGQGCVPILLKVWRDASSTGNCGSLGGVWS